MLFHDNEEITCHEPLSDVEIKSTFRIVQAVTKGAESGTRWEQKHNDGMEKNLEIFRPLFRYK